MSALTACGVPRRAHPLNKVVRLEERYQEGKARRTKVSRDSHGEWRPAARRPDPVTTLEESSAGRVPELIPIRYGRMMQSPFTFFRGAAAIMAADLSTTPVSGIRVQACGDCHLLNFGVFATPERRLVFDINDFDETLPAPWEWDVKRLAASFVVASRNNNFKSRQSRESALLCVRSYPRAYGQVRGDADPCRLVREYRHESGALTMMWSRAWSPSNRVVAAGVCDYVVQPDFDQTERRAAAKA